MEKLWLLVLLLILVSSSASAQINQIIPLSEDIGLDKRCRQSYANIQARLERAEYPPKVISDKNNAKIEELMMLITPIRGFGKYLECKDTVWGMRALLISGKLEIDRNFFESGQEDILFVIKKLEKLPLELNFWEKLQKYLLGTDKLLKDDNTEYIYKEAISILLDSLYAEGRCKGYNAIYDVYFEKILSMEDEKALLYLNKWVDCSDILSKQDENTIYGLSYKEYLEKIPWYRNFRNKAEDKIIDVYFFNDYGFSKERLEKNIKSFKDVIISNAIPAELLGEFSEEELGLAFTTKFLEFDEPQCEIDYYGLCDCDTKAYLEAAAISGADVYVILTPAKCRSYATFGGEAVVSWTRDENTIISDIIKIDSEEIVFEYEEEYVIIHELGHLVWGLRDEYVEEGVGTFRKGVKGFPNCASNPIEAGEWWGDLLGEHYSWLSPRFAEVSWFSGCGYTSSYYRPTEMSIMLTHFFFSQAPRESAIFGPVNDRHMRKVLEDYKE